MNKTIAIAAILGLLTVACSSDSGSEGEAGDCDDVGQAGIELLQDALDALGELSLEELAALGEEDQPQAFTDIENAGRQLDEDAAALDCDEAELEQYVIDRVDELEADGPVAELVLEQLKSDPGALFDG